MNRKEFLTLGAAATAGLVLPIAARAQAQSAAPDPKTYRALSRAATTEAPPGKIEVVEFFWFGCPHCYTLEPVMDKWSESLPADVAFRRVHVPFRDRPHQQLYFTLESMGLDQPKYRNAVFNAIHLNNKRMVQEKEMLEVLAPLGVDAKQFSDTFKSFGVRTKMQRADKLADAYGIDGVPMIGVNGRYRTAPSMAGSNEGALRVVGQLVELERKAAR